MLLEFFLTHSTTLKMRREEQINREGFYHFLCDVVIFIFIFYGSFISKHGNVIFFFLPQRTWCSGNREVGRCVFFLMNDA